MQPISTLPITCFNSTRHAPASSPLSTTPVHSVMASERQARRTAASLVQLGLRREERVFVLMYDNVDWPVAFMGCMYAGIVPVAVNTLLPATDLAYMLEHSRSRAAIVSEALLPTFNEALAKASAHEVQHTWVSKASSPQAFLDVACDTAQLKLPCLVTHQYCQFGYCQSKQSQSAGHPYQPR
jgi:acyl-CoA synthetase (AMP-forming)/AMP-acid ligase II